MDSGELKHENEDDLLWGSSSPFVQAYIRNVEWNSESPKHNTRTKKSI